MERLATLFSELDSGFDLVFSIGTSSVFSYIAEPVRMAVQFGRPTVEINPGVSEVSDLVDIKLTMRAAPALDAIWQTYQQRADLGGELPMPEILTRSMPLGVTKAACGPIGLRSSFTRRALPEPD